MILTEKLLNFHNMISWGTIIQEHNPAYILPYRSMIWAQWKRWIHCVSVTCSWRSVACELCFTISFHSLNIRFNFKHIMTNNNWVFYRQAHHSTMRICLDFEFWLKQTTKRQTLQPLAELPPPCPLPAASRIQQMPAIIRTTCVSSRSNTAIAILDHILSTKFKTLI